MIGLLKGTIFSKHDTSLILFVHGVGYRVEPLAKVLEIGVGEELTLYIYTHVREDILKLYGFSTEDELDVFESLLSVSGIGPKAAMNILSTLSLGTIYQAVLHQEAAVFQRVSGIGAKNAQRIVIDLKSKIHKKQVFPNDEPSSGTVGASKDELISALISLGYTMQEIRRVEDNIPVHENLSVMVKSALKLLKKF